MSTIEIQANQERALVNHNFEVRNTKSSRCREQSTLAKIQGTFRGRVVRLRGISIRPGRSHYVNSRQLETLKDDLRVLENEGRIVMRFSGKDTTISQCLQIIYGDVKTLGAAKFQTSYIADPGELAALIRNKRPPTPPPIEPIQTEQVDEDGVPALMLHDPNEAKDAEVIETEVDLGDLAFIVSAASTGMREEESSTKDMPTLTNEAKSLTVKEAAELLNWKERRVRDALKKNVFTADSARPITIPEEQLIPHMLDKEE